MTATGAETFATAFSLVVADDNDIEPDAALASSSDHAFQIPPLPGNSAACRNERLTTFCAKSHCVVARHVARIVSSGRAASVFGGRHISSTTILLLPASNVNCFS